jgi:hypothetical protein
MQTKEINCLVGIQYMDQRVEYIYVNWDGDIRGVGRVLHTHYRQREKVLDLIMTGSRQGLESDDITPDMETYKEAKVVKNEKEYFGITHPQYPIHYYYLFTLDSTWIVYDPVDDNEEHINTRALFTYFGAFQ